VFAWAMILAYAGETMTTENAQPLSEWIVAQGLQGTDETKVLDALCGRLMAEGVPLLRVNICQPTLHPVIGGHLFIWRRDQPAVEEDWARNVAAAGRDYARTPFEYMMTSGVPSWRKRLVAGDNLGRDAARRVLGGTIERGAGETIRAALWFCDLQGFTRLSDSLPRDRLLGLMHEYFECMVTAVEEQGGHVLKFMGDGMLAIFNEADDGASCRAALAAADIAVERVAQLTARRQAEGLPVTRFYLALHLGDALYGNIGARNRLDFTVIGPAVNEVSRIEAMCRALDQDVIVSAAFATAVGDGCDRLVSLGRYVLRGVRQPQELFTLVPREGKAAPNGSPLRSL